LRQKELRKPCANAISLKRRRFCELQAEKLRALRKPQIEVCALQTRWAQRAEFMGLPARVVTRSPD
jgi:hypothetical protein